MPKWMTPKEEMPDCECGDRIVIIVEEAKDKGSRLLCTLVILEATETGWNSPDPTYAGYTPEDGLLWSLEKDVCGIAHALELV